MSCACENRRHSQELERIRRLAKALARIEDKTVVIYRKGDDTFGFCVEGQQGHHRVTEYISQY